MQPDNKTADNLKDILQQSLHVGDIIVYAERPGHADIWKPHLCFAVICKLDDVMQRMHVLIRGGQLSCLLDKDHSTSWISKDTECVRIDECQFTPELCKMHEAWKAWQGRFKKED